MSKNLDIVILLDFYGHLLTEKQNEVLELYYNEDLSLSEIAQNTGSITRQGVRDIIKRGEASLIKMEQKLGLIAKKNQIEKNMKDIFTIINDIRICNKNNGFIPNIEDSLSMIEKIALETME